MIFIIKGFRTIMEITIKMTTIVRKPLMMNMSIYVLASLLDDVNINIWSIYLVKNIHDGQMDTARRSSWSIYEIASMPDMMDPVGSTDVCLSVFSL